MIKLKNCPFCGGKSIVITNCKELEDCQNFEKCGNSEYVAVVCDCTQGGCGASSGYKPTEKEAIEAWSMRKGRENARNTI